MPNSNKKLIVYDWNGTLLNDTWVSAECFSRIIGRWNIAPVTTEVFRQYYDVPWFKMYRDLGATEEQIAELNGHAIGDNFLEDYEARVGQADLHQGTRPLLQEVAAQGVEQIILSNHLTDKIKPQLVRLNIDALFNGILAYKDFSPQERAATKEDKLRAYIETHNLSPANVTIVGDTPEETRIAHKLGLTSVAFTFGYSSETRLTQEGPHHLARSMDDFANILKKHILSPTPPQPLKPSHQRPVREKLETT